MQISLIINGQPYQIESDPRTLLLYTLREELGLRGAKYGCGEGECGACTVILNGRAVNACLITAGQAHGAEILTVEGLVEDQLGGHLLNTFVETGAVQCGFCTPGFTVSARALLAEQATPGLEAIQRGLSGNLCRCTGYAKIIEAVTQAAQAVQPFLATPPTTPLPIPANGSEQFVRPSNLEEALQLLAQRAGWRVIAGGTDLLVQFEHKVKSLSLLDISGLGELRQIQEDDEALHIGALVSYTDLIRSAAVQTWAPALVAAAREVGGPQIQNRGTLGGNLVNASPAADGVPPLHILAAQVMVHSLRGRRTLPVEEFASGPGKTILAADELLTEIIIPKQRHEGREITFFEKVGPRKAQTIAIASVGLRGWLVGSHLTHVRVALGAVAPTVMPAPQTAAVLMAQPFNEATLTHASQTAHDECRPIDDIRAAAAYRRKLVRGLLLRNLWPYLP
jgi:carbon-monoxide dehydrogenase small subunit/xanthine dehydrogenase small subunit